MGKFRINELNPAAIQLENIFAVMSNEYFGKDVSAKIVGGVKKLEDLIAAGFRQGRVGQDSRRSEKIGGLDCCREDRGAQAQQRAKRQMVLQRRAGAAPLPQHEG